MNKPTRELINAFFAWLKQNPHGKNEDFYARTITQEHLSQLSRNDFIEFFFRFAQDGGKIQSGGHRTAGRFRTAIENQYEGFRAFILEPFQTDFDERRWLERTEVFKGLGQGLATIYLNRVDKTRFAIVNQKGLDLVELLGVDLPSTLTKRYETIKKAHLQLIEWYPEFENFFQTDALAQFLIGEEDGEIWKTQLSGATPKATRETLPALKLWWVNQGKTYDQERAGGYVWAPQVTKGGFAVAHHTAVSELRPGDVIVHYANGAIRAVGLVTGTPEEARRPVELPDAPWEREGFKAEVRYFDIETPIRLEEIPRRAAAAGPFDAAGGVKQGYLYELSAEFSQLLRATFQDRWPIGSPLALRPVWLFQAVPDKWDVRTELPRIGVGGEDSWTVTKFRDQMTPGDLVVVWSAGSGAGIYGLAELTSEPGRATRPDFRGPAPDGSGEEWRVNLRYTRILEKPILKSELLENDTLRDLSVIAAPQGTNFRVTPTQWREIQRVLSANAATGDLAERVTRFLNETGYPTERDRLRDRERQELASELTPDALRSPSAETFRQLASKKCGGAGQQAQFVGFLNTPGALRRAAESVTFLLYGEGDIAKRIERVMTGDLAITGFKDGLVTKTLAIVFPDEWLPAFVSQGDRGKLAMIRALGLPPVDEAAFTGSGLLIETNRRLFDALKPFFFNDTWGMLRFCWWSLGLVSSHDDPPESPEPRAFRRRTLHDLAQELYLREKDLRLIQRLLEYRRQVIFYGPPGTGKTYVARELAWCLAGSRDRVKLVQFHPSYAYEDFVEGYRPKVDDGQAGFRLVDGPLKQIAAAAVAEPAETYVLVIDEINRGNVAKVLGELYFLLEYRNEKIHLQYSSDPFELPGNLWIIGTMNTADRSIALMDAALRRRFHFVEFFPDKEPIKGLLRRWLHAEKPNLIWVADVVDRANELLDQRHAAVGPSHFMRKELTEEWVELIWKHSVLPYIEEQLFGEPGQLPKFELAKLRMSPLAPPQPTPEA